MSHAKPFSLQLDNAVVPTLVSKSVQLASSVRPPYSYRLAITGLFVVLSLGHGTCSLQVSLTPGHALLA